MNLVNGFISAESTLFWYISTSHSSLWMKPEHNLPALSSPSFLHFSNHATTIDFYEWKFLYLWKCRKRVKLKPAFSLPPFVVGKWVSKCSILGPPLLPPPWPLVNLTKLNFPRLGKWAFKDNLSHLVHQTQKEKETLSVNAIWLYLLFITLLFQKQLDRCKLLL